MLRKLLKRLEALEKLPRNNPATVTITYDDGHKEVKKENYIGLMGLLTRSTRETHIVSVVSNNRDYEDDGFWNMFLHDEPLKMIDDSAMLADED